MRIYSFDPNIFSHSLPHPVDVSCQVNTTTTPYSKVILTDLAPARTFAVYRNCDNYNACTSSRCTINSTTECGICNYVDSSTPTSIAAASNLPTYFVIVADGVAVCNISSFSDGDYWFFNKTSCYFDSELRYNNIISLLISPWVSLNSNSLILAFLLLFSSSPSSFSHKKATAPNSQTVPHAPPQLLLAGESRLNFCFLFFISLLPGIMFLLLPLPSPTPTISVFSFSSLSFLD